MVYGRVMIEQITYNASAANVSMLGTLIGALIIIIVLFMLWRLVKGTIQRNDMTDAYYLAKLRKRAQTQELDLDKELELIKEITIFSKSKREKDEEENDKLRVSDLEKTDELFRKLEEQEKKENKKKVK